MNAGTILTVGLLIAILAIVPNVQAMDGNPIAKVDGMASCGSGALSQTDFLADLFALGPLTAWDPCDPTQAAAFCVQPGNPCGLPDVGAGSVELHMCDASGAPEGYVDVCGTATHVNPFADWTLTFTTVICSSEACASWEGPHQLSSPFGSHSLYILLPLNANGVCAFMRNSQGAPIAADCI